MLMGLIGGIGRVATVAYYRRGHMTRGLVSIAVAMMCGSTSVRAQNPSYFKPFPPFRIADSLYYVGTEGLASYLITSRYGHVLINSGYDVTVPRIRENIEKLGFRFESVRMLLVNDASKHHAGGASMVRAMTGAFVMVMVGNADVMESGGAQDLHRGRDLTERFPPTRIAHVFHDGEVVPGSGVKLIARRTPGHSRGGVTFALQVHDRGQLRQVLIAPGAEPMDAYRLVDNTAYPEIADDFTAGFATLRSMPCDILLTARGGDFDLSAKYARLQQGDSSAFVDPDGCKRFVDRQEAEFTRVLNAQRTAASATPRNPAPAIDADLYRVVVDSVIRGGTGDTPKAFVLLDSTLDLRAEPRNDFLARGLARVASADSSLMRSDGTPVGQFNLRTVAAQLQSGTRRVYVMTDTQLQSLQQAGGRGDRGTDASLNNFWRAFRSRYPNASGYVRLSQISYSPDRNRALVYIEEACNSLCGSGDFVLLRRTPAGWRIAQVINVWVS
jgi:metallo-beta-lactamase class B